MPVCMRPKGKAQKIFDTVFGILNPKKQSVTKRHGLKTKK